MLLLPGKNWCCHFESREKSFFPIDNNFYVLKEAWKDFASIKISPVSSNDNSKSYFNSSKTLNILALIPEVLPL